MEKSRYINVDELQAQTTLEDAAARCGVRLESRPRGSEVRIDCPFGCPGDHVGRKEISVNTENPQKVFYCHAYRCQLTRGNLAMLMHGWLTGAPPAGGKLKGEEFNRIKRLLASQNQPEPTPRASASQPLQPSPQEAAPTERNVPLEDSADENVRQLATIDQKFVRDVSLMSPAAARYVRAHPCLSPESMAKWRVGYLPLDGGGDKRGWSLRGQLLFPILSEAGKVLAWIGRDPAYEEKEREFQLLIPEEREKRNPPQKYRHPRGFARGLELAGQQAHRLNEPGYREAIARTGIVVCEGMTDLIALDNLGVPAVALCSNRITEAQAAKIVRWARQLARGKVMLLLDCDAPGDEGAKEALWILAQQGIDVRLAWSQAMHGGVFRNRQPESLTREELAMVMNQAISSSPLPSC